MKNLLVILATIISCSSYCQIVFEKGYYFNNSDQKTECLIKNVQWYNNPTKFSYKLSENEAEKEISIDEVKEFGIIGESKYIRSTVNIDRSGEGIINLTPQKEPIFTNETLFLNVLVEGKATLYFYKEDSHEKYFYKTETTPIEQLINKNYLTTPHNEIASNKQYLVQLWNNLKCSNFTMKMVEKIEYDTDDLTKFFTKFNQCNNSEATVFEKKASWEWLNLNIRPGINSSSLSLNNRTFNVDFDNEISARLGIELEVILPFNKNKWGVIFEPSYMYYKSESDYYNGSSSPNKATVDYKAIELSLGLRYYFFLNNTSKIFINAAIIPEFSQNSTVTLSNGLGTVLSLESAPNLAFGVGYKFMDKFSIECRYINKDPLSKYDGAYESKFKSLSFILGYTIF